ncbi:10459_t:CDS:2 [Scutellospora calospora]|uniref:10459_t:CDS:1 n=1 Tax=Scutellospora calospora TaxID=85575 RepID=A0ACA9KN59_9GLOM|nr:10459_t:CDS:2 [Scutellospora calospora]
MSSTSRVESYNSKIKRLIFNSNTTLLELAEKLSVCILEEDKKTEYALFRASIPKAVLVATANTILPNIKQALQYHAMIISKNELRRYLKINLEDPTLFGENPNFTNIIAKSMLSLVDNNKIKEICNSAQESFLVIPKFEIEQPVMIDWSSSVPYLNIFVQAQDVQNINRKTIDEQNCQEVSSDSDVTSDNEVETDSKTKKGNLNPCELMNPRKYKAKGRPKGIDRIRRVDEPSKKTKQQLYYKNCGADPYIEVK